MNTDALLYEVQGLEKELARLKASTKICKNRIDTLMSQVVQNMRTNGIEKYTYNGQTYNLKEHKIHTRKKDVEKKKDAITVLQEDAGIEGQGAEEVYNKLVNALRGPEKVSYVLKK